MVAIKFITKSGEQIEKMVFKIEESQANTPPIGSIVCFRGEDGNISEDFEVSKVTYIYSKKKKELEDIIVVL